jgi:hypothetical protein
MCSQAFDSLGVERARGLVEDEQLRIAREGAGDGLIQLFPQ